MAITFDFVLNPVLTAFKVSDISQLPAAVQQKYNDVVNNLQNVPGMTTDDLASAMGPALANAGLAVLSGNPGAAGQMLYNSLMGVMTTAGGPIGSAVAMGLSALPSILQAIGGTAQGGQGNVYNASPNGEIWYGAWNLSRKDAPLSPSDSRWVPWTNTKSRTPITEIDSDGTWYVAGDDLAILNAPYPVTSGPLVSKKQVINGYSYDSPHLSTVNVPYGTGRSLDIGEDVQYVEGTGSGVTGRFAWLPAVFQDYPKDSFDYAVAQHIAGLLEQYYNAQGPGIIPPLYIDSSVVPIGSFGNPGYTPSQAEMSLRDMVESMLIGWNATHLPGNPIQLNGTDRLISKTTTFGNKTTTQRVFPSSLLHQRRRVGDVAAYCLLGDPRDQDKVLMLNTGPLLPSLVALYNSAPPPIKIVLTKPTAAANPVLTAVHAATLSKITELAPKPTVSNSVLSPPKPKSKIVQVSAAGAGATVGFMVGGPVGAAIGGILGWVFG